MISLIEGIVTDKDPSKLRIVVRVGGIGFDLLVPAGTLERSPEIGKPIFLYTYLHVREDILQLYGFESRRARDLFVKLMSVSGFGPQKALGVLSVHAPEVFEEMIRTQDIERLTQIPGIGRKSAERLVLEMKDKVEEIPTEVPKLTRFGRAFQEAEEALVSLGFSRSEARGALRDFPDSKGNVEELVQFGLKVLARRK